ncbi:MAG: hypothetical protein GXY25_22340, partial [Pirellulaceae bacterium]|nr:hypothetical protein [Pirellulaceae bacterium]
MLGFPTRSSAYCVPLALLVWLGGVSLAIGQEPAPAASQEAGAEKPAPPAASESPGEPAAAPAPSKGGSPSPSDGSAQPAEPPPPKPDQRPTGEGRGPRGRRPEGDRSGGPAAPGGPAGRPSRAHDPETSYTRLVHPEIAERMGLTDEQRSRVAAIFSDRAAAIAAADAEGRARAIREAEQKLADVLTADQRAAWLDTLQRRSIRFNFRFQLWADVLEWFAEQADLSLVINNPPPGTFNYSDTKEYTPEEAIDILNGVLQTKGFTLIRRDKMLIVHDLSQGIPDGLIPRVSLEELDRRGKFELVSVQFPLGRKQVPVVEAEIKPLLGPHGKIVALPATKQLVVSDMAGVMRAISTVIESVPEPPQPKKEEPKPQPPKEKPIPPELVVYPITKADPKAVQDVVSKMIPNVTLEYDGKRGQLYAYTTPNFQATIAKVLESMEADLPPELDRYLEIYSIKEVSAAAAPGGNAGMIRERYGIPRYRVDEYGRRIPMGGGRNYPQEGRSFRYFRGENPQDAAAAATQPTADTFLNTLQQMVPGAEIHIDRGSNRLMAFATRAEHEVIQSVIEKFGGNATADEVPLVEVYEITHSDPDSLKTMFESLFPGVQVNIDKATNSMVVFAYPSEHATIRSTLDRLMPPPVEGQPAARSATELRFYPLKDRYPPTLQSVLAGLVPSALVTYDSYNDRLIVVGSATDHEIISRGVEQLETAKAEERSRLVVYPVTPVQKKRFTTVLQNLIKELPSVVVLPDIKAGELAIWATALHHEAIAGILEQFKGEGAAAEDAFQLVAYPVKATDPTSAQEMLQDLFPGARMLPDRKGAKLLVWATAAEHEQIKKSIAGITSEAPEEQPRFETYTIRSLSRRSPGASRVLESHLNELVPRATLTLDAASGELIVWATPEEQALVRAAIEKLGQGDAPENTPSLKIYPLGDLDPAVVQPLLSELSPAAQLSIDTKSGNLLALAVPAEQAVIQKTLDELQQSELPENTPELRFHPLKEQLPANVLKLLGQLAPKAEITPDGENGRLMVVATPADHEKIIKTIETVEDAGTTGPEVRFYPLENDLPTAVLTILKTLAPKAQITPDASGKYLTVVATPADHEVVKQTIEQATSTLPPEERPQLVVYAVTAEQQNRFQAILGRITAELPGVQVIPDTKPGQLSIWARPSEHEVLRDVLDELRQELPPEEQFQLAAYPLRSADPASVTKVLEELFPNTKITLDAKSNRLLIWTRAAEQAAIEAALRQIDADGSADEQRRFEVYPIGIRGLTAAARAARSAEFLASLQTLVPNAKLTIDSQTGDLVAFATPAEHEILRTAVEKLGGRSSAAGRSSQLEVHQLTSADPATTLSLLEGLAPEAEIKLDTANKRLIVLAPPETQATIRNTLAQIQPTQPGPNDPQARVINLKQKPAKALSTVIARLAPNAEVTVDEEGKRIVVVATEADQELIRRTVEQIDGALPAEEENTLMVFPVAPAQRKRFEAVVQSLTKEMPEVEIIEDDEPTQLSVWAKPSEHKVIGEILQQLKAGMAPETQRRFEAYSIQGAIGYETTRSGQLMTAATLTTGLQELVPGAKLMIDAKNNKLIAWASPEEHAMLKEAVEKLAPGGGAEGSPLLHVYKLAKKAPSTLAAGLQKLVPGADVALDADGVNLTVVGTPADQQLVQDAVDRLEKAAAEGAQPYFEAYEIRGLGGRSSTGRYYHFQSFMTNLQPLVPNAKLSVDYESGSLTAFATAEEHAILKTSIEKLTFAGPDKTPELKVYTLKSEFPETLSDGLRELAPRARISIDADARQLTVVASAADHQIVKDALDKVDQAASEKEKPFFKVYSVTAVRTDSYGGGYGGRFSAARNMIEQLQKFAPKANMSIDNSTGNILVFATQEEHDAIESALAGLTKVGSSEDPATLAVYRMQNADERAVFQLLQNLAPNAKLTLDYRTDSIMALAVAEDHQVIKNALDQLDPGASGPNAAELRFYSLRQAPPQSLISGLRELARNAAITYDADTRKLMVIATAANHAVIEKNLAAIEEKSAAETKPELAVYPIRSADPAAVQQILESQFSDVRLQLDEKNDRLMVWALPDQQAEIAKAVEKMDDGDQAGAREKTVAYSIDDVDARTAISILQSLAPDMNISPDRSGKKIVAFGRERDHKLVAEAIEQMEAGPDEAHKPYLMIYPAGDASPETVSQMLANLVPTAKVVVDAESQSLAVFAKSQDQETVRAAIESMAAAAVGAGKPLAMNYTLKRISAASAMQILRLAAPKAQLATGSDPQQLLVWASAKDHQTIKTALEAVDVAAPEGAKATAAVYTLEGINPNYSYYTLRTLREAVPQASMTLAADPTQIVVWARPEDHETIKELVKSIVEQPVEITPVMEIYKFESGDAASAIQVLAGVVPQAKLSVGKDPAQLVAWARPADQAKIKDAVAKLEAAGGKAAMKIYTLEKVAPDSVVKMLRSIVPGAITSVGADPSQLVVWATEEEHQKVGDAIQEMSAEAPPEKAPLAVTYTLSSFTAATAQKVLAEVAPDAKITEGEDAYQLIVFARPDEHAKIEETLRRIDAEGAAGGSEKAVVYELEAVDSRLMFYIIRFLQEAVPEATFVPGASPKQLVAWARPKTHEKIKELVEQLADKDHAPTAVVYDTGSVSAATITLALRQMVPDAVVAPGAIASQMVVWARPADQEKIKQVVDQLTAADSADLAPTAITYSLENIDAATATRILQLAAPQAQISQGSESHQLIVLATPKSQDLVKLTLEKIDVAGPADKSKTLGFYQLESSEMRQLYYVSRFLRESVPDAQFTPGLEPGQVIAWARPKDHEKIAQIIEKIKGGEENAPKPVVYELKKVTATILTTMLRGLTPEAIPSVGMDPYQLIVWARPADHKKIQALVDELAAPEPPETAPTTVNYTVAKITAATAIQVLGQVVPQARLTPGADPYQFVAWARPEDQDRIVETLAKIDIEGPADKQA